ncbi:hypothetical protein DUI87_08059 [Hirundo rustica rustica]|uniref:Uncharacterized protein n=1 Tax=Hirundo rustica rustica TaxID=333673 RepID=A0A3M0KWP1_HIRRU|nr:hypothetical protein DUI87_08059 [Hirundo rustica rustica]
MEPGQALGPAPRQSGVGSSRPDSMLPVPLARRKRADLNNIMNYMASIWSVLIPRTQLLQITINQVRPALLMMQFQFPIECQHKRLMNVSGSGDNLSEELLTSENSGKVSISKEAVIKIDTAFLVFHLVTFLYIVYSFSRRRHTLLDTVGQQIEAGEQGDKSVTQAAANPTATEVAAKPDSEAKTPAVAAVKKGKKHTDKTHRPVDDDSGEGSSMPPDTQSGVKPADAQSDAEATDDTQSEAEPTGTKSEAQQTGTRSGV